MTTVRGASGSAEEDLRAFDEVRGAWADHDVDGETYVDQLRGRPEASAVLRTSREAGPVHASEITRLELLVGMRAHEKAAALDVEHFPMFPGLDRPYRA